jgi:selenophosphate synthetase-related protein
MASASSHSDELEGLAAYLRSHPALRAKNEIQLVSDVLGGGSWVHGPGDDGAVVPTRHQNGRDGPADQVIACGEALLPAFVAADPYGAGIAAVLANVNDLAAMGATPAAIVDTIVGSPELAREALRGMKDACEWYDVTLVGGHLTVYDGPPALSAFGVGHATAVLSTTHVAGGQSLVVAACTQGKMRADFPFFRSFDERSTQLACDVRVLASVASSGACVAAKDISMAGLVGSLAMLLEWSRLGVTVDLEQLPHPPGVAMKDWLTCFPAYGFLLCVPQGREADCLAPFHARGLDAAVVGMINKSGLLALRSAEVEVTVLDLTRNSVTGLAR